MKSEDDRLDPNPPREFRRTLDAIRYLENAVTSARGIVLRYGSFYGPDTGVFEAQSIEQIRRRRVPMIGPGDGWWSFLHVDDAARRLPRRSNGASPAYTISWTVNRLRCTTGFLPSPPCSARSLRFMCRHGWRGSRLISSS